eukprot:2540659-Prymnesium_polylepis.1
MCGTHHTVLWIYRYTRFEETPKKRGLGERRARAHGAGRDLFLAILGSTQPQIAGPVQAAFAQITTGIMWGLGATMWHSPCQIGQ